MDANKVGRAISYLRKTAGYTQKELADRIGISDKAVSKWERGLSLPDIAYIQKLSILLGTDSDSLLSGLTVYHGAKWQGLVFLEKNISGIGAQTIIYDKPLVYYQLSYFMLLGIRKIHVICSEEDERYISSFFSTGEDFGINLECHRGSLKEIASTIRPEDGNVMAVYEKCIIFGVDQTRFFHKAMSSKAEATFLATPQKLDLYRSHEQSEFDLQRNQYVNSRIPIVFFSKELLPLLADFYDFSSFISFIAEKHVTNIEKMDRGFVEISLNDWDDILDASELIRILQQRCGMNMYCIEEIAWRRGLITLEQLNVLLNKYCENAYRKYIEEIYITATNKLSGKK